MQRALYGLGGTRVLISSVVGLLLFHGSGVQAASFDCSKASTKTEQAICASPQLSKLDTELSAVYRRLLKYYERSGNEGIKAAQREWIKGTRDACQNVACLVNAHELRIDGYRTALSKLGIPQDDIESNVDVERPFASGKSSPSTPPARAVPVEEGRKDGTVSGSPGSATPRADVSRLANTPGKADGSPKKSAVEPATETFKSIGKPDNETIIDFVRRTVPRDKYDQSCIVYAGAATRIASAMASGQRVGPEIDEVTRQLSVYPAAARLHILHLLDWYETNPDKVTKTLREVGKNRFTELVLGMCLSAS